MGLPLTVNPTSETETKSSTTGTPVGAGANTGAGTVRAKTAQEDEADRMYEEAMEEEYAKREGGA